MTDLQKDKKIREKKHNDERKIKQIKNILNKLKYDNVSFHNIHCNTRINKNKNDIQKKMNKQINK